MEPAQPVIEVLQKHHDVAVGILVRIATGAGAEQHDVLGPLSIKRMERGGQTPHYRIV